ncbi:MAG: VOC family protein [Hyphomonadaceae bacterium]|nr:VOC family protein [Hyphomonadaceae bacterium]
MTATPKSDLSHLEEPTSRNRTLRKIAARVAIAAVAGVALAATLARANDVAATPSTSTSTCARGGVIWWNELLAPETEKLTEFYAKVVGWKTKVVDAEDQTQPPRTPNDRYTIFMDGDQEVAGLMRANHPEAVHSGLGWFTYIQVADVEAAAATAEASGGTVLRPPAATADGARIAVISDPMGNVFGLVAPAKRGSC